MHAMPADVHALSPTRMRMRRDGIRGGAWLARCAALAVYACGACLASACTAKSPGPPSNIEVAKAISTETISFVPPFRQDGLPQCSLTPNQSYEIACDIRLNDSRLPDTQAFDAEMRIYFFDQPGGLDGILDYIKSHLPTQPDQNMVKYSNSFHLATKDGHPLMDFPFTCYQATPPKSNAVCSAAAGDRIIVSASLVPSDSTDLEADSIAAVGILQSGLLAVFNLTHPQSPR